MNKNLSLNLLKSYSYAPVMPDFVTTKEIIENEFKKNDIDLLYWSSSVAPAFTVFKFRTEKACSKKAISEIINIISFALQIHPIKIYLSSDSDKVITVEIPNKEKSILGLKEAINNIKEEGLQLPIGIDANGKIWYQDLISANNLLVGGATNSGKSIFFSTIITSLFFQALPADLQIILIDCKRVEYLAFKDIPYLVDGIIVDSDKAIKSLEWCLAQINKRYDLLDKNKEAKLPHCVIIIDEYSDLMIYNKDFFEKAISDIAKRGGQVGFFIIIGTSRPDPKYVMTEKITNSFKNKLAFCTASPENSITIINEGGAEKLLGQGDMLYRAGDSELVRLQGFYVSNEEIRSVIENIKSKIV